MVSAHSRDRGNPETKGICTHCKRSPSFRSILSSPYSVLSVLHCGAFEAALTGCRVRRALLREVRLPRLGSASGFATEADDIADDIVKL